MRIIFFKENGLLGSIKSNHYMWLLMILILGFLIRFWLLDKRWINPDEGAHIMDGKFILEGLIPEVDYGSRQPLYVFIIAIFLKIFGISYTSARLFPLFTAMGVTLLIFLISKKLFNEKVALLASAIFAFLPLSIVESTIVKTELLTMLFTCLGVYFVISGIESENRPSLFFFLSGVFLSFAYYVRESSLAIPFAIFLFFIFAYWGKFQKILRSYGIILAGYVFVCLVAFAYYSQFMTLSQILDSSINPMNFLLENAEKLFGLAQLNANAAETNNYESSGQPWSQVINYLSLTLFTHSFLFVGFVFSVFIVAYSLLKRKSSENSRQILLPISLLYAWLFSLAVAYFYWTLQRGFFIQYFEEFLPPLSILLAFVIIYSLSNSEIERNWFAPIAIVAFFLLVVFFFNRRVSDLQVRVILYFLITTLVLAYFYFSKELGLRRWFYALMTICIVAAVLLKLVSFSSYIIKLSLYLILLTIVYSVLLRFSGLKLNRDLRKGLGFIAFSLLISSFVFSFAVSGQKMGLDFDCVWSPETVKETSDYIETNSQDNDEVMSGAVIWELESNRRPFMNQSHPLAYLAGISEEKTNKIKWHLDEHPPKFIVLDGYTERTYLRYINELQAIIDEKYELKRVFEGSRYPVKIYELNESSLSKE